MAGYSSCNGRNATVYEKLFNITLRELIFAVINFHEFLEFLTISQKLVPAKIIGDCATCEIREN